MQNFVNQKSAKQKTLFGGNAKTAEEIDVDVEAEKAEEPMEIYSEDSDEL